MRSRINPIEAIVTLPRLSDADERRARWRQVITALGQDIAIDGPPPLDGLHPDHLCDAARVALSSGLVDDLDWISGGAAVVALYELTSAMPAGSDERREFARRAFNRLYGGNAETFAAGATRMALGAARQFDATTLRARVSLLFALPMDSSVNADPLALNLIARQDQFERWVVSSATGPLPARRLAATLLERGAREAVRRAAQGDTYFAELFLGDTVHPTFERLLADREPLVWRHAAVARGLLAAIEPQLREEIDLLLDPSLSPTEWRRAVVSLVATMVSDPETAMQQCTSLLSSELSRKHPALASTMIWGLGPVITAEPEAAEQLLLQLCKTPRKDVAEALIALIEEVKSSKFAEPALKQLSDLLHKRPSADTSFTVISNEIGRALNGGIHTDDSIYSGVHKAVLAYEATGALEAFAIAQEALQQANKTMAELEALASAGPAALPKVLPLLRDLDVSALERSRLYDLLLLGRRPGDTNGNVPGLDSLFDRLGNWVLQDERAPSNSPAATGAVVALTPKRDPDADLLARQRKLLILLHIVDVETARNTDVSDTGRRVLDRIRRVIRVLLQRVVNERHSPVHRILCAALARSLDAAVREQIADSAEILLLVLRYVSSEKALQAIVAASTNPEVRHVLSAYVAFISSNDDDAVDAQERAHIQPDERELAKRVIQLSGGVGSGGSYRSEALRQILLKLGRALQLLANARGLAQLIDDGGSSGPLNDIEDSVERLRLLLSGAVRRILKQEAKATIAIVADVTPISILVERAVTSSTPLDIEQSAATINDLTSGLPRPIGRAVATVLKRLQTLPISPGSDVSVIPLRNRRTRLPDWLMPRRTIGGFYVVRALGSGGVSSVFVARRIEQRHEANAELYALKVPHYDPNTARSVSEQEFMDMFRQEAGALLSLPKHPHLARFVNFDLEASPKPILVMELIRGQAVDRLVRSHSLSTAQALQNLLGMLAGLEAMHRVGVAHLDVKPSNVILREEGTPVLVDFGLSGRHLRPGCGTLEYCAPEILGVPVEDPQAAALAADMYAFACTAFELLTGELLFTSEDETAIISKHLGHDGWPEKLASLGRDPTFTEIGTLLAACLRRDPKHRPSAARVRTKLSQMVETLSPLPWPLKPNARAARTAN
ncbi:MAG TPA: serine/threonine-protein kinase [Polyangiaceae bacterium]|nr:serine/threonine-protein kinase [Polyangiaceae bacterium]